MSKSTRPLALVNSHSYIELRMSSPSLAHWHRAQVITSRCSLNSLPLGTDLSEFSCNSCRCPVYLSQTSVPQLSLTQTQTNPQTPSSSLKLHPHLERSHIKEPAFRSSGLDHTPKNRCKPRVSQFKFNRPHIKEASRVSGLNHTSKTAAPSLAGHVFPLFEFNR